MVDNCKVLLHSQSPNYHESPLQFPPLSFGSQAKQQHGEYHSALISTLLLHTTAALIKTKSTTTSITTKMETSPAVLLLDLPPQALAGIDLLSFTTTPRFRGVRDLPPGLHFVFTGSSTAFSLRHGIWFRVHDPHQLTITRWQQPDEILAIETDQAEQLTWRANIGDIWEKGLTPYRQSSNTNQDEAQDESGDWLQLTSYITDALLTRITQGSPSNWHLTSASSASQDLDDIPGLSSSESKTHPEKALHFLPINLKRTWRADATGRERTEAAQDRSWALNDLTSQQSDAMELLGELQFCFLAILTLNNWSCLEQWKRILGLIFTCKTAILSQPDLFIRAIATLRLQLQHCKDAESGLIDLADEGGSLLKTLLSRFRKNVESLLPSGREEAQDVLDELDDLEAYLREEHGWEFGGSFAKSGTLDLEDGERVEMSTTVFDEEDETGEYAPLVVDLSPEQARLLGVEDAVDLRAKLGEVDLRGRDEGVREGDGGKAGVSRTVVDLSGSEEDEDDEEMDDLEDMDARY